MQLYQHLKTSFSQFLRFTFIHDADENTAFVLMTPIVSVFAVNHKNTRTSTLCLTPRVSANVYYSANVGKERQSNGTPSQDNVRGSIRQALLVLT